VNAGIGGMGEPWAGGSGSFRIPLRVSQRAAEAAGQLADPIHGSIRRLSAHPPSVRRTFPLGPSRFARADDVWMFGKMRAQRSALEGQR